MEVTLGNKYLERAIVPSGASIGEREAVKLRNGDKKRFKGKGALKAVENVKNIIANAEDVSICLDPASSEMWEEGKYKFFKSDQNPATSDEMISIWKKWSTDYPIILLENGIAENDWERWRNNQPCKEIQVLLFH